MSREMRGDDAMELEKMTPPPSVGGWGACQGESEERNRSDPPPPQQQLWKSWQTWEEGGKGRVCMLPGAEGGRWAFARWTGFSPHSTPEEEDDIIDGTFFVPRVEQLLPYNGTGFPAGAGRAAVT